MSLRISPWNVTIAGLALLAAILIGGSLWWQERWEKETFAAWPLAQAEVVSAALEPQPGWTGALGLKPIYRGRVELRFADPPPGQAAHAEFVFHSLWRRDLERLQRRLRSGASIAVLRDPQDASRVHVPQTLDSTTALLAYAAGIIVAIAAAVVSLAHEARGVVEALQSLWYDKRGHEGS